MDENRNKRRVNNRFDIKLNKIIQKCHRIKLFHFGMLTQLNNKPNSLVFRIADGYNTPGIINSKLY
jgi:hypothetical protein